MSRPNLIPIERIILALDFTEHKIALNWVQKLANKLKTFKVGPILFMDSGPEGIREFQELGAGIFLDMKFHDIPSTVEKTARQVVKYGVNMFTVHASGGIRMMESVSKAVKEESEGLGIHKPIILAVTVLTSQDQESLAEIGINSTTQDTVLRLASLAEKANIDGLVCSGFEVEMLRREFGDRFTLVVPGIRPGTAAHDQKRVVTPEEAVSLGADYLVIGRAITEADNPEAVIQGIVESIS